MHIARLYRDCHRPAVKHGARSRKTTAGEAVCTTPQDRRPGLSTRRIAPACRGRIFAIDRRRSGIDAKIPAIPRTIVENHDPVFEPSPTTGSHRRLLPGPGRCGSPRIPSAERGTRGCHGNRCTGVQDEGNTRADPPLKLWHQELPPTGFPYSTTTGRYPAERYLAGRHVRGYADRSRRRRIHIRLEFDPPNPGRDDMLRVEETCASKG